MVIFFLLAYIFLSFWVELTMAEEVLSLYIRSFLSPRQAAQLYWCTVDYMYLRSVSGRGEMNLRVMAYVHTLCFFIIRSLYVHFGKALFTP
jgi:hypothetical protein